MLWLSLLHWFKKTMWKIHFVIREFFTAAMNRLWSKRCDLEV